jgi:flagellar protein FlaF
MSSAAAKAYARVATTTSSPRSIEAQALLKAATKLQEVVTDIDIPRHRIFDALLFNRKLWTIFLREALDESNPNSIEVRQNIANLGIFVLSQVAALQCNPQREQMKPIIQINRNIAAGLSGRGSD